MHILVIPSWYPTEDNFIRGVFFREQAQALHRANIKVAVLTPPNLRSLREFYKYFGQGKSKLKIEDDNGVTTVRWDGWNWIPRSPRTNLMLSLQAGINMFEKYVERFGKPDLIHVHSAFSGGVLANQLKKKFNIPYIITEHSSIIARGMLKPWQKREISATYIYANQLIVVSPSLGKNLSFQYPDAIHTWNYIPNIADQIFTDQDLQVKQEIDSKFRFLNIGGLNKNKGQTDLLYAFAKGFRGHSDIELRLGGIGPSQNNLEQLANELNIQDQVLFLGKLTREQVLKEMQHANVFVLSSRFETFGVVLVEALACGKCVVATACGGPECIVKDLNGLLVPTQSPNHLCTAMQQIRKNVSQYSPIEIRNDCLARFGEKAVIKQLTEIYNTVINR